MAFNWGKWSDRAYDSILESVARINIWDGSVRWRFFNAPERGTISANIAMLPGAERDDTRAMLREMRRVRARRAVAVLQRKFARTGRKIPNPGTPFPRIALLWRYIVGTMALAAKDYETAEEALESFLVHDHAVAHAYREVRMAVQRDDRQRASAAGLDVWRNLPEWQDHAPPPPVVLSASPPAHVPPAA